MTVDIRLPLLYLKVFNYSPLPSACIKNPRLLHIWYTRAFNIKTNLSKVTGPVTSPLPPMLLNRLLCISGKSYFTMPVVELILPVSKWTQLATKFNFYGGHPKHHGIMFPVVMEFTFMCMCLCMYVCDGGVRWWKIENYQVVIKLVIKMKQEVTGEVLLRSHSQILLWGKDI